MLFVWLGAFILFCIFEAATAALVSLWFAAGALAALIAELCGCVIWVQVMIFFVVSIVVLICLRPMAKKLAGGKKAATNADALLGKSAYVTETINDLKSTGAVRVSGKVWTARSLDPDEVIPAGAEVKIERIEGVKLIVYPSDTAPIEVKDREGRCV